MSFEYLEDLQIVRVKDKEICLELNLNNNLPEQLDGPEMTESEINYYCDEMEKYVYNHDRTEADPRYRH